jgi:ubiquinone/menaquinone biosynthesis C-methylase UbiE
MVLPLLFAAALAQAPAGHGHGPGHGGQHGNPGDLRAYIQHMEAPDRAQWQKPDEVVKALGLKPGQTACEVGAGPGYFALRMAPVVGPDGAVFAVDVEPQILEALRERIQKAKVANVVPVLALPDDPLLPSRSCDLIAVIDTYHHFPDGPAYLKRLARSLKPGGRFVNIDFHKKELPVGPPPEAKVAREAFLADAKAAGFELVEAPTFLPYQYFLVFRHP